MKAKTIALTKIYIKIKVLKIDSEIIMYYWKKCISTKLINWMHKLFGHTLKIEN